MDQGIDVKAMYAGKKTLAMVERYSHQSGEHIRAAMNKLDRRYRNLKG